MYILSAPCGIEEGYILISIVLYILSAPCGIEEGYILICIVLFYWTRSNSFDPERVGGIQQHTAHTAHRLLVVACKQIVWSENKDLYRTYGKGRLCCLGDVLECHTSHLAARLVWRKVFGRATILGGWWFVVWCELEDHPIVPKHPIRQVSIF